MRCWDDHHSSPKMVANEIELQVYPWTLDHLVLKDLHFDTQVLNVLFCYLYLASLGGLIDSVHGVLQISKGVDR